MNTKSRIKPDVAGECGFLSLLRRAAFIAVPVGAAGCIGLTLWSGRQNESRILLVLFTLWVFSPFLALALANAVSKSWSVVSRAALHSVALVVTLVSLAMYGDVHLRPAGPNAFVFIVVPPASWLIIAIVVAVAALKSGRRRPRRNQVPE